MEKLRKRNELPQAYTSDLDTIYPNESRWDYDFNKVRGLIPGMQRSHGTLGDSSGQLLACLELRDEATKLL